VKERLLGDPRGRALVGGSTERVGVRELAVAYGVSTADVEEMIEVGLLSAEGTAKSRRVRREDSWLVGAARRASAGCILQRGQAGRPDARSAERAATSAFFDWSYPHDNAEMASSTAAPRASGTATRCSLEHAGRLVVQPRGAALPELHRLGMLEGHGVRLDQERR
jgi:hypothetical protein